MLDRLACCSTAIASAASGPLEHDQQVDVAVRVILGLGPARSSLHVVEGRRLHIEGYEGKVVAIDRGTDVVVASADTPQDLLRIVRARGLRNTMIVRVPSTDEPLRVGLG